MSVHIRANLELKNNMTPCKNTIRFPNLALTYNYVHFYLHLKPLFFIDFPVQHDPAGTSCAPGGSSGNYIMYPSATDGSRPNNNRFSECSVKDMGATIENNGGCFLKRENSELIHPSDNFYSEEIPLAYSFMCLLAHILPVHKVPVSRNVVTEWWRETKSVTVALLSLPSAGRGTPVVPLVIAPSTIQPFAGEDLSMGSLVIMLCPVHYQFTH